MGQRRYQQIEILARLPGRHMNASAVGNAGGNLNLQPAPAGQVDGARGARVGLLQRNVHRHIRRLAPEAFSAAAAAMPGHFPQPAQQIRQGGAGPAAGGESEAAPPAAQILHAEKLRKDAAGPARPAAGRLKMLRLLPAVAVAVILAALVGVGQHLVGGVDRLEPFRRPVVAGVDIGMMLPGQPPVRLPDFLLVRCAPHAQNVVIISHSALSASRKIGGNAILYHKAYAVNMLTVCQPHS